MSVARNTVYLTVASILQKIVAFVYFTVLANRLGPEETGAYFLTLSIILLFSVLADWGVTAVVIRAIASRPSLAGPLVREAIGLKAFLGVLAILAVFIFVRTLDYEPAIIILTVTALPLLLLDSFSLLFYGVLRGLQMLQYEARGMLLGQVGTALFGGLVLWLKPDIGLLILALIIGSGWNFFYAGWQVIRRLSARIVWPIFSPSSLLSLLRQTGAFGLAALFVKISSSIDSIFISKMIGQEEVGVYAVAYKLTYAFQFLPLALVGAIYPAMSERFSQNSADLGSLFHSAMRYMALLAVPITFGLAITADVVLPTLYPNGYEGSVAALQILVFVLFFLFLDFPIGSLLNAAHRQRVKTAVMGLAMAVNVVLNFILIPPLGIIGACIAALVSFFLLFAVSFFFVGRVINYGVADLLCCLWPFILAGLIMAAAVLVAKPFLPLIPLIVLGGLVYLLALPIFGAIKRQDWLEFRQSFIQKPAVTSSQIYE